MRRRLPIRISSRSIAAVGIGAALLLTACSDATESSAAADVGDQSPAQGVAGIVDEAEGRTIVDVRTPDEYDAGHLDGAVNIDVQDPSFDERIAELPKDGAYLAYCRSGNRSAAAVARMRELGFTDVVDGGGFDALVAAGLPAA